MTADIADCEPAPRRLPLPPAYLFCKRVIDLAVALLLLALLIVPLLTIAILVRITSPGPALFRQIRIGHGDKPFAMLKFRSMYVDSDDCIHREMNLRELQGDRSPPGATPGSFKLQHDPRITPIGRWLRRYSLDELPQILNVLRGEMSLVGPRPSLPWEVELFTPEQQCRHDCLPGITGLWQVSDRYALSMPEMLALDLRYLESRCLMLDLAILLRTPIAILFERC